MDKITLPINLLNAIMGYLGKQPYDQVFQLIAEVQKEAQAQQPISETPNGN
jgi:hypothetical protein